MEFDQYLGFLAFLSIFTMGFWLMFFLLLFVIPYWLFGYFIEQIQLKSKKKLKRFLNGELEINETFDIKKWAWYFAVTDLTYTFHGVNPNQVKLFYNPVSGLFEPIPYDGHRFNKNFNKNLKTFESRSNFEMASTCLDPKSPCRNKLVNDEDTTDQWRFRFFYRECFCNYYFL